MASPLLHGIGTGLQDEDQGVHRMMLERDLRPTSGSSRVESTGTEVPSRRSPVSVRVATLLSNARLLRQHGEKALALTLLRTASNLDSKNPAVLVPLAESLEDMGRMQEAVRVRAAVVHQDCGFESVFRFAQASYKLGRDEEALHSYYEALSLLIEEHPALFEIHKNMGNIFVRRGDFEAAEECYNKAYAIQPKSAILTVNLGTLEVQRGDFERALTCFRRAVELDPSNDKAWAGLAMLHAEFGDFDLAWGGLERALDLDPFNRTAVHLAAQWAVRDRTPQRALQRVQTYMENVDSDEEMSLALIHLFCIAGRLDLASLEVERVLAWDPSSEKVLRLRESLRREGGAS